MTAKEFSRALGCIGERYVEEAVTYTPKKKPTRLMKWGAFAACFALIVSAVVLMPMLWDELGGIVSPAETTPPIISGQNRLLCWDDVSSFFGVTGQTESSTDMYEKAFYEIIDREYSLYKSGVTISDTCVGNKLDEVMVRSGWHQSWDGKERDVYKVKAEVYAINGVDSRVAVALRYLEKPTAGTTEHFYVFANEYCEAETVSALLETYCATAYMSVGQSAVLRTDDGEGTANRVYRVYENTLPEIKNILLELNSTVHYSRYTADDLQAVESIVSSSKQRLQLTIHLVSAGGMGVAYVLDNGYICFVGFGKFFALYSIGSDTAQRLIDTVTANAELLNETGDQTEETTAVFAD